MEDKRKAIIVDLDGTLCNIDHRLHHFKDKPKKWLAFFEALKDDTPNEWCLDLIESMSAKFAILFVSGRPAQYYVPTKAWLTKHNVGMYDLYLREQNDFRPDAEVKEDIYRNLIEPTYDIVFSVDDRQAVVDQWRKMGVTCLQCARGDY